LKLGQERCLSGIFSVLCRSTLEKEVMQRTLLREEKAAKMSAKKYISFTAGLNFQT